MGTVIKADGVGRIKKHLAPLGLKDHMAEAQRVVRDARAHALQVIEDARQEAVRCGKEARRKGHEQGFEEGRAAGETGGRLEAFDAAMVEFREQQAGLVSTLEAMMDAFEEHKRELLDRAQHDLLEFAVVVAECVVKRTAAVDRQVAVENAREAIRQITDDTDLVIRAHPVDMESLRRFSEQTAHRLTGRRHVSVLEDETIGVGGCIVESRSTRVDATVESQFRQAAELLLGETGDREQGTGTEGSP